MVNFMRPWWRLVVLASALLGAVARAETPTIRAGEPLVAALEILRAAGLDVVYSDRLVGPDLRVQSDPGLGRPAQVAARILAPHGLRLEPIRPGRFAIVRAGPALRAAAPEAKQAGPSQPLEVVTVYASRYSVDTAGPAAPSAWSREDIASLPGLEEDILRVTRYLPGTASNGLSARTNVRGGRDDEVAVWFDGVPLFEPFHFKDYSATIGLVDPASIERLDFYSGVFPARYGERLSAVMDVTPRRSRGGAHHEVGLSLLSAHLLSVGESGSAGFPLRWLASGRSSTTQLIAKALGRDEFEPEFTDMLLRLEGAIGDWTLTAGAIALRDELRARSDGSGGIDEADAEYRDSAGWFRVERSVRDGHLLEATVSVGSRRTDRAGSLDRPGLVTGFVDDRRRIDSRYARLEWRASTRWRAGIETTESEAAYAYLGSASFDPWLADLFTRSPSFDRRNALLADGRSIAAYASRLVTVGRSWRLDAGLRLQYRSGTLLDREVSSRAAGSEFDRVDLEPRLALEYALDERTTLRLGVGRTTQATRPDELAVADGDATFFHRQAADQIVLGAEWHPGPEKTWRLEAYRKDLRDPAPRFENLLDPVTLLPELEVDRTRIAPDAARLYGIELSGRVAWSRAWSGWLSYTWSEASDRIDGRWVPRSWNQLHSVVAGAAWKRGSWELSASAFWHSGWQRSVIEQGGNAGTAVVVRNGSTWGDFASLDLRASWTRPLHAGALRVWADLSNATQHRNPCCSELRVDRSGPAPFLVVRERDWLPRYAVVGVTWEMP